MNYSSRFFLYAPIVLFLALAAGVSLYWWHAASAFEQKLAAIKGREAMPGVTLDWASAEVGGFPFRVDAVLTGFTARGQGPHGAFRWQSPHFALHRLTYMPNRLVFEAAGRQDLSWVDAAGRPRSASFQPGSLHASALLNETGLARFDLDITQFAMPALTAARVQFHLRQGPDDTIEMVGSAEGTKGDLGLMYEKQVKQLRVYNTLVRAKPYAAVLKGETAPAAAHTAWHDAGGAANVTRTELNGVENGMRPEQAGHIVSLMEALY